jgi:hypothetical protein
LCLDCLDGIDDVLTVVEDFAPFVEAMVTITGLLDVCPCNALQPEHEGILILLHFQKLF